MKTGILITARLGSTRLKKKHLLDVNKKPILFYLLKRILTEFYQEINHGKTKLIIASSDEPENREFELFSNYGADVFYGSIYNIPLRHLQAAQAHALNKIIAIDGDDILCSVSGMRCVYNKLNEDMQYIKTSNLPFGMNSFGYSTDFLESCVVNYKKYVLETGWGRIFDTTRLMDICLPFTIQDHLLRFTLDYKEDYQFFKSIIQALGENVFVATDEEIVDLVIANKFFEINKSVSKNYWDNFNKNMDEEKTFVNID